MNKIKYYVRKCENGIQNVKENIKYYLKIIGDLILDVLCIF